MIPKKVTPYKFAKIKFFLPYLSLKKLFITLPKTLLKLIKIIYKYLIFNNISILKFHNLFYY